MVYIAYEEYKSKYYEAQQRYNTVLNEKEELFSITQPKATDYKKEIVKGGSPVNTFDKYLILKEKKQIDQRLQEIKAILDDREKLFKLKEAELRRSKDIQDKTYVYRYLDNLAIKKIALLISCGEATVYRILKSIKNNLK